jgi:alpha-L-fucosidase 2
MKKVSQFGEKTAREMYHTDGWVVHHTTDIYGRTGVHDSSQCGFFPLAGPWMCMNLWDHYEYTGDRVYLENTLYPILKGACQFLQGYLIEDRQGRLVTNPSNSPENKFYYIDRNGQKQSSMFTYGATIDFEIIYAVFHRMIYATRLLGRDEAFASELEQILTRIPKLQVGERYGTIREWIEDYEEVEPQHRHISHLFGLHPSDQINESDPAIFEAAKRTIARRLAHGGGQTGWSRAWIVNFYARLLDGENAVEHLRQLLRQSTVDNLFDMHPPFQIDGNFGGSAGVAEMLLQSHLGSFGERVISILPAVPAAWKSGSFKGLCARGNFYVDAAWAEGKLTEVTVHAPAGGVCRVKLTEDMRHFHTEAAYTVEGNVLTLATVPGGVCRITFN